MVQLFTPLCRDRLPDVKVTQIINESMIEDTIEAGYVRQPTIEALITFSEACFKMGTELVMVTCSSIGPAVDLIQSRFEKPVLRIDEPMAEAAVAKGWRRHPWRVWSSGCRPRHSPRPCSRARRSRWTTCARDWHACVPTKKMRKRYVGGRSRLARQRS